MKFPLVALLAASLLAPTLTVQAAEAPIAIVSMQKILEESKKGKEIQKKFESSVASEKKEVEKREGAIKKMQEEYNRDEATMSDEQRRKKQRDIQKHIGDLQQYVSEAQEKMSAKRTELLKTLVEPAKEIVVKVAKEKGIGAVFERGESGLLYAADAIDLTPEVIKRIDSAK